LGGKTLTFAKLAPFNDCINACVLSNLKYVGSKWSWHNSEGNTGIIGRLDRILVNQAWIDVLPDSFYEYQSLATSDHAPLLLHLLKSFASSPRPFRFFNYWMQSSGFKEMIKQV